MSYTLRRAAAALRNESVVAHGAWPTTEYNSIRNIILKHIKVALGGAVRVALVTSNHLIFQPAATESVITCASGRHKAFHKHFDEGASTRARDGRGRRLAVKALPSRSKSPHLAESERIVIEK